MSFVRWTTSVDRNLQSGYAVTIKDVGISECALRDAWKAGDAPVDYVRWFAQKYELISRRTAGVSL